MSAEVIGFPRPKPLRYVTLDDYAPHQDEVRKEWEGLSDPERRLVAFAFAEECRRDQRSKRKRQTKTLMRRALARVAEFRNIMTVIDGRLAGLEPPPDAPGGGKASA